ncbi:MAG: hypothetical protein ABSC25_26275 [Roseiarcus sp.]
MLDDARTNAPRHYELGLTPVPSLIRLVIMIAGLAGLVYGGMLFLVANVKVEPREMSQIVTIPKAPQ